MLEWAATDEQVVFEGQHQGYLRLPAQIIHRRRIELSESRRIYEVHDFFVSKQEGEALPKMSFNLMLHPDCEIAAPESGAVVVRQSGV